MSYVRFDDDSDVYAWHDGEGITCMVKWQYQEAFPEKRFTNHGELFRYLMFLRDRGLRVPNYALASTFVQDAISRLSESNESFIQVLNVDLMEEFCPELRDSDLEDPEEN